MDGRVRRRERLARPSAQVLLRRGSRRVIRRPKRIPRVWTRSSRKRTSPHHRNSPLPNADDSRRPRRRRQAAQRRLMSRARCPDHTRSRKRWWRCCYRQFLRTRTGMVCLYLGFAKKSLCRTRRLRKVMALPRMSPMKTMSRRPKPWASPSVAPIRVQKALLSVRDRLTCARSQDCLTPRRRTRLFLDVRSVSLMTTSHRLDLRTRNLDHVNPRKRRRQSEYHPRNKTMTNPRERWNQQLPLSKSDLREVQSAGRRRKNLGGPASLGLHVPSPNPGRTILPMNAFLQKNSTITLAMRSLPLAVLYYYNAIQSMTLLQPSLPRIYPYPRFP